MEIERIHVLPPEPAFQAAVGVSPQGVKFTAHGLREWAKGGTPALRTAGLSACADNSRC